MKKRISSILAVVLTLTLLVGTFAMLGLQTSADTTALVQTEDITVDGTVYSIESDTKVDAYTTLKADVSGLSTGTAVSTFSGWSVSYQYLNTQGFNKKCWGNENISYQYNSTDSNSTLFGIRPNYWFSDKVFGNTSVSFEDTSKKLFVSPFNNSANWEQYMEGGENAEPARFNENTIEPAWKLSYTIKKAGKVVLFDTTGKITASGAAVTPYWANEYESGKCYVRIYKSGQQIWPAEGSADILINKNNPNLSFPDLGELEVNVDDTLDIIVYDDISNLGSRNAVFMNPAIAYIHEHDETNIEKTDATYYKPGTINGKCDTCGTTWDNEAVYGEKTTAYQILPESIKFNPSKNALEFSTVFDAGFIEDWKASDAANGEPYLNLAYTIAGKSYSAENIDLSALGEGNTTLDFSIKGYNVAKLTGDISLHFGVTWKGTDENKWQPYLNQNDLDNNPNLSQASKWVDGLKQIPTVTKNIDDIIDTTDAAYDKLSNLISKVEAADSAASKLEADNGSDTNWFVGGASSLNMKDATISLAFDINEAGENSIKDLNDKWLSQEGITRRLAFTIVIDGVTHKVTLNNAKLYKGVNTLTLSGLSYEQLYSSQISMQLVVAYYSGSSWKADIYTDAIEFTGFKNAIDNAADSNELAAAIVAYQTAQGA